MKSSIKRTYDTVFLLFFLVLITKGAVFAGYTHKTTIPKAFPKALMGDIDAPGFDDVLPSFQIYYEGRMTQTDSNGIFSLPLDKDDFTHDKLKKLTILICRKIEPHHQAGSTLDGWQITDKQKYRLFDLYREWNELAKKWQWKTVEKYINSRYHIIPGGCIVIPISPTYFHKFVDPGPSPDNRIKLPKILLKGDKKWLLRQADKSSLRSITTRVFHAPVRTEKQIINGIEVSMQT